MAGMGIHPVECVSSSLRTIVRAGAVACGVAVSSWTVLPATAQSTTSGQSTAAGQGSSGTFTHPTVVVAAQKEPADAQTLPVSVTTVSSEALERAGAEIVSEAARYVPNTYFSEFSARKLSNARVRGIGASPANPAVAAYFDGVPQLHANASSIDLVDVEQVEFVRGPQSALFGRNALGGVINVTSARPSLDAWTGSVSVPLANTASRELRGSVSGPLVDGRLGMAVALEYDRREGYTINDVTGNDLDSRSAFSGKGQLLWNPAGGWETRLIVSGERARDGDYALSDLAALRANPFHTARDFEGDTMRDVVNTTILASREGSRVTVSTATGFVRWATEDRTDLDYSPLPLLRRSNDEESFQFTQEVRIASAADRPLDLGGDATLRWQAGVFVFTQDYDQHAVNAFAPFVLSPFVPVEVSQTSPTAALDDVGIGVYGQGTATLAGRVDVTAGVRFDHEQKDAVLGSAFTPAIAPPLDIVAEESFSNVSPQVAAAVRLVPEATAYASVARGYKAGGFNAASPLGSESYGEEHTWSVEGGLKTTWAGQRVAANLAVFLIDWEDMQLNVPDPGIPGQFYIANVGGATSSGVELELNARAAPGVDLFSAVGYTRARFKDGSVSSGADVSGNTIPNTPGYTATFGAAFSRDVLPTVGIYARGEVSIYGTLEYDDLNTARQEAYSLASFRAGVRRRHVFVEGWIRNAFDTRYVPVAFAYGALAPSGFIGEMGAPRTFGVTSGVGF
jgi:iron complex outermembrane receptor protein